MSNRRERLTVKTDESLEELNERLHESLPTTFLWRIETLGPRPRIVMVKDSLTCVFDINPQGEIGRMSKTIDGSDTQPPRHQEQEMRRHASVILKVIQKELAKKTTSRTETEAVSPPSEEQQEFHFK